MALLADAASARTTITDLIAREEDRFLRRQPHSAAWTERARGSLAGGATSSWMIARPGTVWISHGQGSKVYDVDGTEYVDLHAGYGVMIVGHAHPAVVDAVERPRAARHPLRAAHRGCRRGRRGARPPLRAAAVAVLQLRHRSHDGRRPPDAGHHRSRPDHQDRGQLPRPPRRGHGLDVQRRRRARPARAASIGRGRTRHPAGHGRPRGRGALQRPRHPRAGPRGARGPGGGHDHGTADDERRHRAAAAGLPGGRACADPQATVCCWPSTRSRPASRVGPGGATRLPRGPAGHRLPGQGHGWRHARAAPSAAPTRSWRPSRTGPTTRSARSTATR